MLPGIFKKGSATLSPFLFRRATFVLGVLFFLQANLGYGQKIEYYRWILQDSTLKQDIAHQIIQRINKHLYNVNPDAQLLREDESVSLVVSVSRKQLSSLPERTLVQVQAGPVIEEENLQELLDSAFISRLIERSYFWREEPISDPSVVRVADFNASLKEIQSYKTLKDMFWWSPDDYTISMMYIFARFADRAGVFLDFGNNELGYPSTFLNSGSFRFGVAHEFIKVWVQSPLPGSNSTPIFTPHALDAGFGGGAAFDVGSLGGELAYASLTHPIVGLPTVQPGKVNYISDIIQVYYILPYTIKSFFPGALRMKFGGGLHQVVSGYYDSTTHGAIVDLNRGVFRGGPYLKAEFISADIQESLPVFAGSLQYYNGTLTIDAAYNFASWIGVEAQYSLIFSPDAWERSMMWTFSPRIFF